MSHCLAGPDVGLQNAAQLLHGLWVLQDVHVLKDGGEPEPLTRGSRGSEMWVSGGMLSYLGGLLDDAVPHLIGQQHIFLNQVLLNSLVCLGSNHISYCFIKRVHLYTHTHTHQHVNKKT